MNNEDLIKDFTSYDSIGIMSDGIKNITIQLNNGTELVIGAGSLKSVEQNISYDGSMEMNLSIVMHSNFAETDSDGNRIATGYKSQPYYRVRNQFRGLFD